MKRHCANCRFMQAIPDAEFGFCRRDPIQAVGFNTGVWPPVRIKDGIVKHGDQELQVSAVDSFCHAFRPRRRWWQVWKSK